MESVAGPASASAAAVHEIERDAAQWLHNNMDALLRPIFAEAIAQRPANPAEFLMKSLAAATGLQLVRQIRHIPQHGVLAGAPKSRSFVRDLSTPALTAAVIVPATGWFFVADQWPGRGGLVDARSGSRHRRRGRNWRPE